LIKVAEIAELLVLRVPASASPTTIVPAFMSGPDSESAHASERQQGCTNRK
jgi:hypothetical protein